MEDDKRKYEEEKDEVEQKTDVRPSFKKEVTKKEWEEQHDKYIPEIQ